MADRASVELAPVPRLALTRAEAAASLGMSLDSFERYVQWDIRLIRHGRLVLVSVKALEEYLDRTAEPTTVAPASRRRGR